MFYKKRTKNKAAKSLQLDLLTDAESDTESTLASPSLIINEHANMTIDNSQAHVWHFKQWLQQYADTQDLFQSIKSSADWSQPVVTVFGKQHLTPRKVAFYANDGLAYTYSQQTHIGQGMPEWLRLFEAIADDISPTSYNSVLINHYRDGQDSMGWHSDDEQELGSSPWVVSISLGAARKMRFRHKANLLEPESIELQDGDVLVMNGQCQKEWQHCIPKSARVNDERINLTFRNLLQ